MSTHSLNHPSNQPAHPGSFVIRSLPKVAAFAGFEGLLLFGSAGRLDWTAAWMFIALYAALQVIGLLVVPHSADLLDERTHMRAGIKAWDKPIGLFLTFGPLLLFVVCGLDQRYGWTPPLEAKVQVAGLALCALGQGLVVWALAANRFFSRFVRIQAERGHQVVSSGPYRFVRHPGYVGGMIVMLGSTLALASLWALLLSLPLLLLTIIRTALEDRTLHKELDGYAAYAARVRYRLIPGVW
jgi:protein-S-isoprenylcysteine O-methyltransferase Ste14